MRKRTEIIWSCACLITITCILIPYAAKRLVQGQLTQAVSNVRQIHLAIETYHLDYLQTHPSDRDTYPKTLQDLVAGDYLKQSDLDRLMKNQTIVYHPPPDNPPPEFIMLEAVTPSGHLIFGLGGNLIIIRK